MNRIDRLTALMIFLQGRKFTEIEDISERFKVSARTVYRDLKALQEGGLPIGFETGRGYFLVGGYHLPPLLLQRDEAASLLMAEKLIGTMQDPGLTEAFRAAVEKVRSVLKRSEKDYLQKLDDRIKSASWTGSANGVRTQKPSDIFHFLQNAIAEEECISISYRSAKSEHTDREIEPVGILFIENRWYLAAWCRMRKAWRTFRITRIEDYRQTGQKAEKQFDRPLSEFLSSFSGDEVNHFKAVVCFDRSVLEYTADSKHHYGWISEQKLPEKVEMTFETVCIESMARWLLSFGNKASVQTPASLRERIFELSEELYRHHTGSPS
jgi:predicted DNA-binding transcriptional regulator YafY